MNEKNPGEGKAVASLVLGILGILCWIGGVSSIGSLVFGIIGLIMASKSSDEGYNGSMRTAGFLTSLIALIVGALILLLILVTLGVLGSIFAGIVV